METSHYTNQHAGSTAQQRPNRLIIDIPYAHSWDDLAAAVEKKIAALDYDHTLVHSFTVTYAIPVDAGKCYDLMLVWRNEHNNAAQPS